MNLLVVTHFAWRMAGTAAMLSYQMAGGSKSGHGPQWQREDSRDSTNPSAYEDYSDLVETAGFVGGLTLMWYGPAMATFAAPIAIGYTIGFAVGSVLTASIWGEEGLTDFNRFLGGSGNYISGDEHGSGYFNIPKNVYTIVTETQPEVQESFRPVTIPFSPQPYRPSWGH